MTTTAAGGTAERPRTRVEGGAGPPPRPRTRVDQEALWGERPDRRTRVDGAAPPPRARTRVDGTDGPTTEAAGGWTDGSTLPPFLAARFTDVRPLPAGAQAFVYRARDRGGDEVVVRVARPGHQATLDERTLEVVSASPHLVTVREVDEHDGVAYQVYDFVPGPTLAEHLRVTPRPPEAFVADFVAQMCDALEVLGQAELVHGDLQPQNVIVGGEGSQVAFVVIDFGLTRVARHTLVHGVAGGTPEYVPPEGFLGHQSRVWDWWSLGMIVAEMRLGRHPLAGAHPPTIGMTVALGRFELGDLADDERWSLLARGLLTRDHERRWAAAQVGEWLRGGSPAVADERLDAAGAGTTVRTITFGGREHHDDPRQLADHLGSDWEGAARFVGSPVFRAALGEWAGQFGDLDLLGAVERLDDGDVPLDHHVIALIGALYDVRLDGHRGVGRSWYRGRVLNAPILHQICERALEDVEALGDWDGDPAALDDHPALAEAVRLVERDLAVLAASVGAGDPLRMLYERFAAGSAFVDRHVGGLRPSAARWERTLWRIRLLQALTGSGDQVRLRADARRAARRRRDLAHLVGPRTGPAHHLVADIWGRRTPRRTPVRALRELTRRRTEHGEP